VKGKSKYICIGIMIQKISVELQQISVIAKNIVKVSDFQLIVTEEFF
jgi:hypothetical protein